MRISLERTDCVKGVLKNTMILGDNCAVQDLVFCLNAREEIPAEAPAEGIYQNDFESPLKCQEING